MHESRDSILAGWRVISVNCAECWGPALAYPVWLEIKPHTSGSGFAPGDCWQILAKSLGYTVEGIDLFRTRFATATAESPREKVVLLMWR